MKYMYVFLDTHILGGLHKMKLMIFYDWTQYICLVWKMIYLNTICTLHEPVFVWTKGLSNILYVRNICILQLLYMVF